MPQLNPSPWLSILLWSWVVFIIFLPMLISKNSKPNFPSAKSTRFKTSYWHWPWS